MLYSALHGDDNRTTHKRANRIMRRACLLYLFMLSFVMLFIGNPLKYTRDYPRFVELYEAIEPGLHVGIFAVLAFLVVASRWRIHPLYLASLLVVFAAGTELIQMVLPNRTPRFFCFVQDVIGLLLGAAAWGLVVLATRSWHTRSSSRQRRKPPIRLEPFPVTRQENEARTPRADGDVS